MPVHRPNARKIDQEVATAASIAMSKAGNIRWGDVPWLIGTAVVYALLAKIILTFYSQNGLVSIFWPGAGVSLAALLLGGRKFSLAIYAGALAGQLWAGESLGTAVVISLGSVLEPLLGTWLLSRNGDFDLSLASAREYFRLCALAGVLSPGISAVLGTLLLSGRIAADGFWQAMAHWWMGDMLGIVVVAPMILVWRHLPRKPWNVAESVFLFGLAFLIGQIIHFDWFRETFAPYRYGYWIYLVASWAAVRLGPHAVLGIILMVTLQALMGATQGLGIFGNDLLMTHLTNFWSFMIILTIVSLSLAIILTELKLTMADLRSSENRLRLAKTAAGLGVYDYQLPSGTLDWDDRARELWGIEAHGAVSYATFLSGVHPDDRAATEAAVARAFAADGDGKYSAEYRAVGRSDGRVRHLAASGRVFFKNGQAVRSIGILKDISAQKGLEMELQERRSAMELLVKQQVAAQTATAIAHELNQPLISVSAYSEAALRMLRGGTKNPEKLERALEGAMEQAQRAGRTLNDLLDFLQKGNAAREALDLNDLVREALAIAAESGYDEFPTEVELQQNLPPVLANRLQLQKVLVNLLHNSCEAIRATRAGTTTSSITVRTFAGENDMAQVTVRDNGPGFAAEMAEQIFEPFFTTKSTGIGLGLAISRALIDSHGGKLWSDTGSDAGATFHFTLPFAP